MACRVEKADSVVRDERPDRRAGTAPRHGSRAAAQATERIESWRRIVRLHRRFEAEFDNASAAVDMTWFPAWLLTQAPALARHLAQAQRCQHSPPEQGMRLLLELLGLERQGRHHDLVQRRRALRDVHAALYAAYMATR